MSTPSERLSFHAFLLGDESRVAYYRAAIAQTVKDGDVVVDIGAGSGILSFLACEAGAQRVYGLEVDESLFYAEAVAAEQPGADRISFIRGSSLEAALPERADVLLSDTGGRFGIDDGLLGIVIDARKRHLKPDHVLVPCKIELYVSPVTLPRFYSSNIECWNAPVHGVNYAAIHALAVNIPHKISVDAGSLLGPPALLASIDLRKVEATHVSARSICVVEREGELHGFCGWYRTHLTPDLSLCNSPLQPNVAWTHTFFPIDRPVPLRPGAQVSIAIKSNDGQEWSWTVDISAEAWGDGDPIAQFAHSTLAGSVLLKRRLERFARTRTPVLSRLGQAELFALQLLDGSHSIARIEQRVFAKFSDRFSTPLAVATFVNDLVERHT